jgi:predicted permease
MNAGYITLLSAVAPVFLVIVAGYLIRRAGWLTAHADASLMRLIVNVLVPCLIVETILGNRALDRPGNLLLPPLVGFSTVVLGYGLSYFAAPLFSVCEPRQRRTFAFVVGIYNYGYVPLPVIRTLFDSQTTAVLFIHNVGVETALWTVGIALLSGGSGVSRRWSNIFNAPLIAILATISLHFFGARAWLPEIAIKAIDSMGQAAIPLGLILTGATFADQMREPGQQNSGALSLGALLLRLGALPILMLALARWLPCPIELRRVIVVQAAMPCAVIPVILAQHYGGDAATAMRIVLVTSAIGLLTIPLWLKLGLQWVC